MNAAKFGIVVVLLIFGLLTSCSKSNDGKYSFKNDKSIAFIELEGDDFLLRDEYIQDGKINIGIEIKAKYHISESNFIILDKMISGKNSIHFQKSWNAVKVELKDDKILFYEGFDRNEDLMEFRKE
jgi:major membrane immunogen (membrane-anchored lipoprotein)